MKKIVAILVLALSFTFPIQSGSSFFSKVISKVSRHKYKRDIFQKAKTTYQESSDEDEDKEDTQKINVKRLLFSPYYAISLNAKRYLDNRTGNRHSPNRVNSKNSNS